MTFPCCIVLPPSVLAGQSALDTSNLSRSLSAHFSLILENHLLRQCKHTINSRHTHTDTHRSMNSPFGGLPSPLRNDDKTRLSVRVETQTQLKVNLSSALKYETLLS